MHGKLNKYYYKSRSQKFDVMFKLIEKFSLSTYKSFDSESHKIVATIITKYWDIEETKCANIITKVITIDNLQEPIYR